LLLARWNHRPPRILLADEPTRGIDLGAKAEILASLEAMAAKGMGIAMVSSELEEVTASANSVVVLSEGHQVGTLANPTRSLTPSHILKLAFGVPDAS
jgi:ABC-type sugar transport system ATPase subunit